MRADYGLRAMIDLAQHEGQGSVHSGQIAERQGISEPYLDQLLTNLRKAGLIRSVRGPSGGHNLAKPAASMTLADIVLALEGQTTPMTCMQDADHCQLGTECAIRDVWLDMETESLAVLRNITLAELAMRQAQKQNRIMYHI
jgi:Rrf2 family protein